MISSELEDPRLTMISVTEVAVSRDLRSVRVFIHQADSDLPKRDLLAGLQSATPYMRRQLAQRCGLRVVPELNFVYDDTPERAARIDELLQQIAQERRASEQVEPDSAFPADSPEMDSDAHRPTESHPSRTKDLPSERIRECPTSLVFLTVYLIVTTKAVSQKPILFANSGGKKNWQIFLTVFLIEERPRP